MAQPPLKFPVKVTIVSACSSSGPCDIYGNSDNFTAPLVQNVLISTLTSPIGYVFVAGLPSGTTILRIQNTGTCTNYVDVPITF